MKERSSLIVAGICGLFGVAFALWAYEVHHHLLLTVFSCLFWLLAIVTYFAPQGISGAQSADGDGVLTAQAWRRIATARSATLAIRAAGVAAKQLLIQVVASLRQSAIYVWSVRSVALVGSGLAFIVVPLAQDSVRDALNGVGLLFVALGLFSRLAQVRSRA